MDENSSDSDYQVEEFVQAKRVRRPVNDDTADLLGNFDDVKRQEIFDGTYVEPENTIQNPSDAENSSHDSDDDNGSDEENTENNKQVVSNEGENSAMSEDGTDSDDEDDDDDEENSNEINTNLSKEQLASLLRGASKTNRHVLYVTNLNFETQKEDLETHFSVAGTVKSVRIPKQRRGGFAFVEMADMESFQRGFQLHNTELQGRNIKVQISEAGKKKSANKKNIIKQKNRKLSEMRNEQKTFTKSGKFYDKTLKKEKAKKMLARKRWRKPAGRGGGMANKQ